MPWYRTGTVAVTNGSPNIVGTGTLFLSQASVGDIFVGPDLALYEVTAVPDDLNFAVKQLGGAAAYAGATLSAQNYAIIRNFTSTLPAQLAASLAALMASYHVTLDELVAWLSGTGTVEVHDAVGNVYNVKTPAQLEAEWGGRLSKSVAGGAEVVLTTAEAGNLIIELTGTLTANINVVVPAEARLFLLYNNTAGAYALTVKTPTGSGVVVARGGRAMLECDETDVVHALNAAGAAGLALGLFRKADPTTVAFVKTGAFAISTQAAAIYVEVDGAVQTIPASTAVTMPGSPTAGTDYAIWAKTDGTLECTSNHVTPPTANARRIGGFHYAPGGNASAQAGGDTTPAINAYSIWDLKFRPACPDPRGMTLVADGFWADIYLLGVDHPTNGSSKYNVTIADGSSPPKIPAKFGGNGTTAYAGGNWWDMGETLRSFGKRHPTYDEFAALAYGTTEAASATAATDPVSTILRAESTSKWGVMLSTGNLYVWGAELGGPYGTAAWTANTGGRGSTYNLSNAVLLGGDWSHGAASGSRCSHWGLAPTSSANGIGARGVCDHLQLD